MDAGLTGVAAPSPAATFARRLSAGQATLLGVTIVVGSGLLVLPGVAYRQAHGAAIYAWAIDAALVVPLLAVFAALGRRYPTADGVAGFARAAFGRAGGTAAEVLLLGTFALGIPAIAVTGAGYAAVAIGAGADGRGVLAFAFLLVPAALNWFGSRLTMGVQTALAAGLVGLLGASAVAPLLLVSHRAGTGVPPPADWSAAIPVLGTVFFAYTGWEMLSFTAEEYRNPRRDLPLSVAGSFCVVVVLYILVALCVQVELGPTDPSLPRTPIAAVLGLAVGPLAGRLVAAAAVVVVLANLVGAMWAASRLIFASARAGLLPGRLAAVHRTSRVPRSALLVLVGALAAVCVLEAVGLLPLDTLLRLAGQNFFVVYTLSVLAFVRLAHRWVARAAAVAGLLVLVGTMATFGWNLAYAGVLLAAGAALGSIGRAGERS